jgi:hypothetical protein
MADIIVSSPPPDYTSYYASIATALGTIATNSTEIKNSLATIATQTTTIATQTTTLASTLGEIEGHQQKLRELGEGTGIHVIGPWEWVGLSSIVKLLQDKGADFAALKSAVESLPKNY